jgi:excisionase family DNA binding protein
MGVAVSRTRVQNGNMPLLTVIEAAQEVGRSRQWIYSLAERKKIKSTRDEDGRLLIDRDSLLAYDPDADPGGKPRKSGRVNKKRTK